MMFLHHRQYILIKILLIEIYLTSFDIEVIRKCFCNHHIRMLSTSTSSWKTKNQISAPWYSPHSMLINAPRNMSSKWEIALNEKHQNTNQYAPSMILSHSTLESERSITRDTLEFHITYKWIGNQMPIINTYIHSFFSAIT
jgi:phosphorylcholine metabolism protein LicD